MTNLLVINASLNGESGNSSTLTREFVAAAGDVTLTTRNLDASLGHLEGPEMQAWMTPAEQRSEAQTALAAVSDEIVA